MAATIDKMNPVDMQQKSFDRGLKAHGPLLALTLCVALLFAALLAIWAWGAVPPLDEIWTNRDFANYWLAARLTLDGQAMDLFSGQDIYFRHMQQAYGADYPWHAWSYPPHYLLLILPFGALPFVPAGLCFLLVTLMLYLHAITVQTDRADWQTTMLLVPFLFCNVLAAQNGFLTAALVLYGIGLRERRPVLAGITIGLLTVKPQLGFLLPLLLLFERRWLVLAAATLTTAVTVIMSIALFGLDSWVGYISNNLPYQALVMRELEGIFTHMIPSVYGSARSLQLVADTAIGLHLPVAALALAVLVWSLFALKRPVARACSLVYAGTLIAPYSLNYDLGALVALTVIHTLPAAPENRFAGGWRIAVSAIAILPLMVPVLGMNGVPLAPLVIAGAWALLIAGERSAPALTKAPATA